jgi:lactoylglutathione lyase
MKLNHINLAVPDIAATRAFFEKFFGLRCAETKGDVLAVLMADDGFILILSHFEKQVVPQYPRDFHVGFIQDTVEKVNEIYEQMKAAGVDVRQPKTAHGSWGFYVAAPGGITVEVASYENGG